MEDIGRRVVMDISGHSGVVKKVRFCKTMINGVLRSVKLYEVQEDAPACPAPVVSEIFEHNIMQAVTSRAFSSAFSQGFS